MQLRSFLALHGDPQEKMTAVAALCYLKEAVPGFYAPIAGNDDAATGSAVRMHCQNMD